VSHRLRRLWQHPQYSLRVWLHRLLFWAGAVMVAVAAVSFEWLSSHGSALFKLALSWSPLLALIITPAGFVLVLWLTPGVRLAVLAMPLWLLLMFGCYRVHRRARSV